MGNPWCSQKGIIWFCPFSSIETTKIVFRTGVCLTPFVKALHSLTVLVVHVKFYYQVVQKLDSEPPVVLHWIFLLPSSHQRYCQADQQRQKTKLPLFNFSFSFIQNLNDILLRSQRFLEQFVVRHQPAENLVGFLKMLGQMKKTRIVRKLMIPLILIERMQMPDKKSL